MTPQEKTVTASLKIGNNDYKLNTLIEHHIKTIRILCFSNEGLGVAFSELPNYNSG